MEISLREVNIIIRIYERNKQRRAVDKEYEKTT